jgi:hypothetical protein
MGPSSGPPGGASPPPGDPFRAFVDQSMAGLQALTEAHMAWGLGNTETWGFGQDDGLLRFTSPGRVVTTPAQIIGSYDARAGEWMWAWANPSVAPELAACARRVKAYGEEHGYAPLTTARWTCPEQEAWEMTAIAVRICEQQGAYRGPAGSTYVFFAFGNVTIAPAPPPLPG